METGGFMARCVRNVLNMSYIEHMDYTGPTFDTMAHYAAH